MCAVNSKLKQRKEGGYVVQCIAHYFELYLECAIVDKYVSMYSSPLYQCSVLIYQVLIISYFFLCLLILGFYALNPIAVLPHFDGIAC